MTSGQRTRQIWEYGDLKSLLVVIDKLLNKQPGGGAFENDYAWVNCIFNNNNNNNYYNNNTIHLYGANSIFVCVKKFP